MNELTPDEHRILVDTIQDSATMVHKGQMMNERIEIDCPSCGGNWYTDLDESGVPYTCFHCCNGTLKCYEDDGQPTEQEEWHDFDPEC